MKGRIPMYVYYEYSYSEETVQDLYSNESTGCGIYLHDLVLGEDPHVIGRGPGGIGDHVGHHQGDVHLLPCLQTHSEGTGVWGGGGIRVGKRVSWRFTTLAINLPTAEYTTSKLVFRGEYCSNSPLRG